MTDRHRPAQASNLHAPVRTASVAGTGVYFDDDGYYRHDGARDADTFGLAGSRLARNSAPALLFDLLYLPQLTSSELALLEAEAVPGGV